MDPFGECFRSQGGSVCPDSDLFSGTEGNYLFIKCILLTKGSLSARLHCTMITHMPSHNLSFRRFAATSGRKQSKEHYIHPIKRDTRNRLRDFHRLKYVEQGCHRL